MRKITYASFEVTSYCNLDCSFCNRRDVIKKPKHISINEWQFIIEQFKNHPLKEVKLQGLGEPFLHPEFHKLCEIFKKNFPNCKIITATNCQYKINNNFKLALKFLDMIYFSIDGYKENYERFRNPSKWVKLIKFLEDFKKVDRFNCRITCNYVVNKDNIQDIKKIDELCKKYGIEELRLNIAQNWSQENKISQNSLTFGYTQKQIQYLRDNFKTNIKGKAPWTWSDCFWPKEGVYITSNGDINLCALTTNPAPLGNIFKENLDSVFCSQNFFEIKKGCEENKPSEHCKNCSYKELSPLLEKLIL